MVFKLILQCFRISRDSYNMYPKSNENVLQLSRKECTIERKTTWFKARYMAVVVAFMGEFFLYFFRATMSVGIVAMVKSSTVLNETEYPVDETCTHLIENNYTTETMKSMEGEFQWSPEMQGYILGSSFLAYILALPFLAKLAEIYGGKKILLCCIFFPSLFTFLSPLAARWSVHSLIVIQSLRGILQGGILPSEAILMANWFPKQERGSAFTVAFAGCSIGAVIGNYLTGALCDSRLGWPSAFYVNGCIGFVASAIICIFLYDNPSVHPRISPSELEYILSNQENVLTEKRPNTPWKSLLTSVPVYALSYAYFGQMWAMSQFLTANPTFLKTILHYSVEKDGLFNAIPFMLQIVTSQTGGLLASLLIKKFHISIDKTRKFMTFFSCFGYSACVLGIYFAGCNRNLTIVLSIAALSFIGFAFAGCWVVCMEMSPTFIGSINAISCSFGSLSHFIMPVTVGYLTNGSQTMAQWHKIFIICIAVVLSSGIFFSIFGSAEIQPWNDVPQETEQEKKQKTKTRY